MTFQPLALLRRDASTIIFCSVLTGSIGLNIALALKYRAVTTPHLVGIRAGTVISRIPVASLDGRRTEIALDGGSWTVLYVMAPGCSWCARNLDNIRTLASQASGKFRFVGLSNTATNLRHYLSSTPLPFSVDVVDLAHAPPGLNVSTTPQMALVGPQGQVTKVWVGALAGKSQAEVEKFFNVKLPGWRQEVASE